MPTAAAKSSDQSQPNCLGKPVFGYNAGRGIDARGRHVDTQPPTVFISYSRPDRDAADALLAALRPALRNCKLQPFIDQDIQPGEHWRERIEQALADARAAVLLISNGFLNSKFILDQELPVLLPREQSGRLQLFTVYLTAVAPAALKVPLPSPSNKSGTYDLQAIQALNTPDTPLDQQTDADRNALFAALAQRLHDHACPPAPSRRAVLPRPGHSAATQRPECWLRLHRDGRRLQRELLLPGYPQWRSPALNDTDALDALELWQPGLPFDGDRLFELLFGADSADYRALLSDPWGDDPGAIAEPSRWPWRIWLSIDPGDPRDQALAALPWTRIAHRGTALFESGWTVELGPDVPARNRPELPPHTLNMPGPTLLVFPELDTDPAAAAHLKDLRGLLDGLWGARKRPSLVFEATDRAGIERHLADSPRLVYVYGRVEPADDGWRLRLTDGQGPTFADLRGHFTPSPPSALFLNLLGDDAVEALPETACLSQPPGCRFVALQATPRNQPEVAQRAGLAWLEAILSDDQRLDPVTALHGNDHAFAACRTAYSAWDSQLGGAQLDEDLARLLLDRDRQRSALNQARDDFIAPRAKLRVQCFLAAGTPGNRIEDFPQQALTHLQLHHRTGVRVLLHGVSVLPTDQDLDSIELRLRRALDLPSVHPAEGLRPKQPRLSNETLLPILAWGLKPGADPAQRRDVARAILRFNRERLAPGCPDDIRVLSLIALEPDDADELDTLRDDLQTLDDTLTDGAGYNRAPAFRFEALDPLGGVDKRHLRAYFGSEHCTCPDDLRLAYPGLLLNGRREMPFDEAVDLIRAARDQGWRAWKQAREGGG